MDNEDKVDELGLLVDDVLIELRVDVLGEFCAESERRKDGDALIEPLVLRDVNADIENDAELDTDPLRDAKLLSLLPLLTVKVTFGDALLESLT